MRRLSIIDLAGGQQPIWNETRDVAVIFNGELYNYRELRERLTMLGHRLATQSDTEILVHAWEEWGEECLTELRGMFAFALLDLRGRFATAPLLFLARDPLGIKPLYYTQTPEGFAFASEVRSLLASGIVPKQISQDALTSYLLFGSTSEPVTMLEGVFLASARPSHAVVRSRTADACRVRVRGGICRQALRLVTRASLRTWTSAASILRPLLEDAVRAHLIADVPVGPIPLRWAGLRGDCRACGARTGGNPQLHAVVPGNFLRRSSAGPQSRRTMRHTAYGGSY